MFLLGFAIPSRLGCEKFQTGDIESGHICQSKPRPERCAPGRQGTIGEGEDRRQKRKRFVDLLFTRRIEVWQMLIPHSGNGDARQQVIYVSHEVVKGLCESLWNVKPFAVYVLAALVESASDVIFGPIRSARSPPTVEQFLLCEGICKCPG